MRLYCMAMVTPNILGEAFQDTVGAGSSFVDHLTDDSADLALHDTVSSESQDTVGSDSVLQTEASADLAFHETVNSEPQVEASESLATTDEVTAIPTQPTSASLPSSPNPTSEAYELKIRQMEREHQEVIRSMTEALDDAVKMAETAPDLESRLDELQKTLTIREKEISDIRDTNEELTVMLHSFAAESVVPPNLDFIPKRVDYVPHYVGLRIPKFKPRAVTVPKKYEKKIQTKKVTPEKEKYPANTPFFIPKLKVSNDREELVRDRANCVEVVMAQVEARALALYPFRKRADMSKIAMVDVLVSQLLDSENGQAETLTSENRAKIEEQLVSLYCKAMENATFAKI